MSLPGVDPNDPRPSNLREIVFAAGQSPGAPGPAFVLIYGNKTSAGSETDNVIGAPINDDADAVARFGRRSEWYSMYRAYVAVDPSATIYGVSVPEGVSATAAKRTITFATNATAQSTVKVTLLGQSVEATVGIGDTPTIIGDAVAAAINAADGGGWPVTAANVTGVVTVTAANKGPRGGLLLNNLGAVLTRPATTTCTVAAVTAGTIDDDLTLALAEVSTGVYKHQIIPNHATVGVTGTDNSIGEASAFISAQFAPGIGKDQRLYIGLVGTQAQATAVATSGVVNSPLVFLFHSKNSPWTPGMIAAHHAAIVRKAQIAYPAANLNGYTTSLSAPYLIPQPTLKADRLSPTEVIADLNNGVCPIEFTANGTPVLTRFITSRSLNAQSNNDYRAREGHITACVAFAWDIIKARWDEQRQPNIADDPAPGAKPIPLTSTPNQLKRIIWSVIDDLAGPTPLGTYPGPILAPDRVDTMKASVTVTRSGATLVARAGLESVMHLLKSETTINETSQAY